MYVLYDVVCGFCLQVGSSSDCRKFMHARAGHGTPAGFLPKSFVPGVLFFICTFFLIFKYVVTKSKGCLCSSAGLNYL